ncbi:MAG TPA: four helix bundle protein [Vicinamibacterales bacterium]
MTGWHRGCSSRGVTSEQLRDRTQAFASSIVRLCIDLRGRPGGRRIADQLEDAATSTAANYRAVCRAHTRPAFIAKLSIVVEEADETLGWLETLERACVVTSEEIAPYKKEANELVAIFVASRRTASGRR